MILKKIYTKPSKFFEPIDFVYGVNFVYAYRNPQVPKDAEGTINNLGKSSFLDLTDFCLCSDFDENHSPRLFNALEENLLTGITVYLEFWVGDDTYLVSRSFDTPKIIRIVINHKKPLVKKLKNARELLCDIIFSHSDYSGFYSSGWLRTLFAFYIKILKHRKAEYPDPFYFLDHKNIPALLQFHLFLLDINNTLFAELFQLGVSIKKTESFEKETRYRVMRIYGLKKFEQAEDRLRQMETEVNELKDKLVTFHLAHSQQINSNKANELSKRINELTLNNYLDQQKIDAYNESLKNSLPINLSSIEKLYNETKELLGSEIRKSLEDAVTFKKQLKESRKGFVAKEIESLTSAISERHKEIKNLDMQRAEIYKILSTANSIKNYSDSRNLYDAKLKEAHILEEQINTSNSYTIELAKLKQKESLVQSKIPEFRESIRPEERAIANLITAIHSSIYHNTDLAHTFSFFADQKIASRMKMNILEGPKKHGKGMNKVRSLIYDLAVLFYSIDQNYNAPRFIIHDGIFDGVDKAKSLETIEFLDRKVQEGYKFQYIVTLNDEGVLKDYGEKGEKLHQRILDEAIIKLTPSTPLFRKNY